MFGKAEELAAEYEKLLFTAEGRNLMDECTISQDEVPGIGVSSRSVVVSRRKVILW